ncbi:MAG: protein-glutamate O-methyltransferase CheR [Hyphomicrobiaceae bacterium]|nr:protein-glutamate O-methyltransferase CheR [Hyphomicrobiaceae bacterium]
MTPDQFNFLRAFLKEHSGLVLGEDKRYLLDSRLNPVAKQFNHASLSDMVVALKRPGAQKLSDAIIEAMTINESFFFRDMTPFDNFRNIMLPHMLKERATSRKLRIWSAAASTGQEGYSLAIELLEQKSKMSGWRTEILGTDLSTEALAKARAGAYTQFEVQRGMPSNLLMKYFKQQGAEWMVAPAVKSMVTYKPFNLLKEFRSLGQFDIVFCRNVLIYFDRETKADILQRMAKQMAPDGYLVLGAAETIIGLSDAYKMVPGVRGLYQRSADKAAIPAKAKTTAAASDRWKAKKATAIPAVKPRTARPLRAVASSSRTNLFAKNR